MSDGAGGNGSGRDAQGRFTLGNPGGPGRPRGKALSEILDEELENFQAPDGHGGFVDGKRLLARKMIRAALADLVRNPAAIAIPAAVSLRAAEIIYDRIDGAPAQTQRVEGVGGRRLNIGFVPMTAEQLDAMDIVEYYEGTPGGNGDGETPDVALPPPNPGNGGYGT